jgi:hypothetical protein
MSQITWLIAGRATSGCRRRGASCNDERASCRVQSQGEYFLVMRRVVPRVERLHQWEFENDGPRMLNRSLHHFRFFIERDNPP